MSKIGFIGLGHMGAPMVRNLLKAGNEVTVFDLSDEAMQAAAENGAVVAPNANAVAEGADAVFTMLQTGDQVKAVCLEENALFSVMPKNVIYVDCSSIAVDATKTLQQKANELGILMVDAPVSGGVKGAEAATLTFMVGGTDGAFQAAEPLLSKLGKAVIHAGSAGCGQAAKICNNMVLGISMIAVSEAFTLAEKLGLAPEKFFDIASKASGQCWSMTSYCPVPGLMDNVPSNNDYQPGFTSAMMLKDLNLSQSAADGAAVHTPLGEAATKLYEHFVESGHADLDFSAIIKSID